MLKKSFTAVGHLTPFLDEEDVPYFAHANEINDAIETVEKYQMRLGMM